MPPPTGSLKPSPASAAGKHEKADKEKDKRQVKPDSSSYTREQDELNKEIEGVKKELVRFDGGVVWEGLS